MFTAGSSLRSVMPVLHLSGEHVLQPAAAFVSFLRRLSSISEWSERASNLRVGGPSGGHKADMRPDVAHDGKAREAEDR
jgi:hypothetical protein